MTTAHWSETVRQMISDGAESASADLDEVVAYLGQKFGAPAASAPTGGQAPRSKNEVPDYGPIIWQMVEGKPIETRWLEKQDAALDFPGQTRASYHASAPHKATVITAPPKL